MDPLMVTCSKCKAKQDVSVEAKKVREQLPPNTFGAYAWQCKSCGAMNRGMVDAPLQPSLRPLLPIG